MKKILNNPLLLLILSTISINSFAQQKLLEYPVRIARPQEAYITTDTSGNIACILQSNKEYEVDFLNGTDYKVAGTAIAEKLKEDKSQQIVGATLDAENCYVYFYNKKLRSISCLRVKKSNGECKYIRLRVLPVNQQFLRGFAMNGRFYALTVPKMNNVIQVLEVSGFELSEMNFTIEDMPSLYSELSKNNEDLNTEAHSEVGVEVIKYDAENNLKSAYPTKKLYHFDNKIVLTFDDPNLTHFITIHLDEQTAEYKKLNFSLDKGNNSPQKQGNSFLYKNRFFRTTISPDQLNVTILDLDSMTMINTYNFSPGEDISIVNGPIVQEGGTPSHTTEERIIKKSEQFFRRVLNGNLAIAANPLDDQKYEIEVGSYEIYVTYKNSGYGLGGPTISMGMGMGMGIGMGGIGIGSPGFGSPYGGMYPGYGWPGYYSSQPTARSRVVYFKSLLSNTDFTHLNGSIPPTLNAKINEYESKTFRFEGPEVIQISPYGSSGMILGYYQKNGKRFHLVEFRR